MMEIHSKWKLPDVGAAGANIIKRATSRIQTLAKELVPVVTHMLKKSIVTDVTKDYGKVGTNIKYAQRVEYGSSKWPIKIRGHYRKGKYWKKMYIRPYLVKNQKPKPYIVPAAEKISKQMGDIIVVELNKTTK